MFGRIRPLQILLYWNFTWKTYNDFWWFFYIEVCFAQHLTPYYVTSDTMSFSVLSNLPVGYWKNKNKKQKNWCPIFNAENCDCFIFWEKFIVFYSHFVCWCVRCDVGPKKNPFKMSAMSSKAKIIYLMMHYAPFLWCYRNKIVLIVFIACNSHWMWCKTKW